MPRFDPLIEIIDPVVPGQDVRVRVSMLPGEPNGSASDWGDLASLPVEVELICERLAFQPSKHDPGALTGQGVIEVPRDGSVSYVDVPARVLDGTVASFLVSASFMCMGRYSGHARRLFEPVEAG